MSEEEKRAYSALLHTHQLAMDGANAEIARLHREIARLKKLLAAADDVV